MNKLLCMNLESQFINKLILLFIIIFLAFLIIYFLKAYKNKWTIRQATQYALLIFTILSSFCYALILNIIICFLIDLIFLICLRINENNKFNGFDYFENKCITSILKKYQKQDQHKFFMMNDDEKKLWKENCKNPIKIGFFKSVIIVYIPFVFAIFIRLKLA